ncbi:MAG TPA: M56 family metallopeptidase [Longimicrobiales bacterium]|nr:M56 family metallopeptidase [Longimicrobiales bacterium]
MPSLETMSAGWLLMWLVKGSVLLALLFPLASVLRRASSSTRHLVWTAGLAVALVLPLTSFGVLPLRVELPAAVAGLFRAAPAPLVSDVAPSGISASSRAPAAGDDEFLAPLPAPQAGAAAPSWNAGSLLRALFLAWAVGAAALLLRLAASALRLRRIVREGAALTASSWTTPLFEVADRLDLPDVPRLLVSEDAEMPFVCGLREPAIVLPPASSEWTDEERRAVLCHELAHVRRRDLQTHLLGRITCALYWFQPLAWSAARRMRAESERACDDLVLVTGTRPSAYADHLLRIVTAARQDTAPVVALPMAQAREFEARLLSILAPALRREPLTRVRSGALVALVLLIALPLVALTPVPPQPDGTATALTQEDADDDGARRDDGDDDVAQDTRPDPDPRPQPDPQPDPDPDPDPDEADVMVRIGSTTISVSTSQQQPADPRVRAALIEALRAPDVDTRRAAAWALANHPHETVFRALATAVAGDESEQVREMGVWSLAELESRQPYVIEALTNALGGDRDEKVRSMAAWALGQLDAAAAVTALESSLRGDRDDRVRATAAWALGQIGARSSIQALGEALGSTDASMRQRAAWAIGQVGNATAPPRLIAAASDPDKSVRVVAIWSLGQLEDVAAVPALTTALGDEDPDVRRAAVWALGNMPDGAAIDALTGALRSGNPDIRSAAAAMLGGRGSWPWPWPWPWPIVRISP